MPETNIVYLLLAVCSAVSLLLIGLSVPLAMGKIARNRWYGFRTPKTLADDDVWYQANRAAAVNFILAGMCILLAAAVIFAVNTSMSVQTDVALMAIITITAIVAAVIKSFLSLSGFAAKT